MNMYQAINNGLRLALNKDSDAGNVFFSDLQNTLLLLIDIKSYKTLQSYINFQI